MANWKDTLRRASFRGVPFYTESHGGQTGRRWADHQYPGRDIPYAEDLGRSQRVWTFTGYLIGDDYPQRRDQLVRACELAGSGELVHPTIGSVLAVCRSVSHREERTRGRYVTLDFEFAEAGQLLMPGSLADMVSQIAGYALPLGTTAASSFGLGFDTTGGGAWLTSAAENQIVGLSGDLRQQRLPAPGVDQSTLDRRLAYLDHNAGLLARDPQRLSYATDQTFAAFTEAGEAVPVMNTMLRMAARTTVLTWLPSAVARFQPFGMIGGPAIYRLPVIERRRVNTLAYDTYCRCLALRELGYAIPGVPLYSYDEAMLLLDEIAQTFIELEGATADEGDDDAFRALADLRAAISRLIRQRATNLTPLINYRVIGPTPGNSLAMAWRMYQDSGRDLEVVERVVARNPAFLPFTGKVLAS
jgi:hypothetical protein